MKTKSELFEITEEQFKNVFDDVKQSLEKIMTSSESIGEEIREKILLQYKGKPEYEAAIYLTGEIIGKMELGQALADIAFTLYTQLKEKIKKDTDLTDDLLKNYRSKTIN